MTIEYDKKTDSICVVLLDDIVIDSEETSKDVIIDYNKNDEVVAIEILNVKDNSHTIDLPIVLKSA